MWRCKWVELQLRKFQSMAIMYDKEIEKHNQAKRLKYKNFDSEGGCAKSMPYFHDSQREKLMKRKIRKRPEEWDPEVYTSQHNLFSFFGIFTFNYSFRVLCLVHWMGLEVVKGVVRAIG